MKTRRFIRKKDGVITNQSGTPISEHLQKLSDRGHENCSEAICIKDILSKPSDESGIVKVKQGQKEVSVKCELSKERGK